MRPNKRLGITVFFPCFNDEHSIGKLVCSSDLILSDISPDYELIVIDDGSTDNSRAVLERTAKKIKHLKLIFHGKNRGYGGVLKSGFETATKELVFYTDGDGQYDVGELPLMVELMTDDVDFINGIKMERKDYVYRIIVGNLYNFLVRWVFVLPIFDVDCDFRLIRRSLLKKISLSSSSGAVCVELVKGAQLNGGRFRQISVHHYERAHGTSQFFKPFRILHTFWELLVLRLRLV